MADLVRIDTGSIKAFVTIVVKLLVWYWFVESQTYVICHISSLTYWGMLKDYYDDEET